MISAASEVDFPAIAELWWESVQATHGFVDREYLDELRVKLVPEFLPHVRLYIYRDDEEILGFLGLSPKEPLNGETGCIEMLFVDPKLSRRGIGRALINHAISLDARRVSVNEANEPARRFYEAAGFQTVSRSKVDGTGMPYPLLNMEYIH